MNELRERERERERERDREREKDRERDRERERDTKSSPIHMITVEHVALALYRILSLAG